MHTQLPVYICIGYRVLEITVISQACNTIKIGVGIKKTNHLFFFLRSPFRRFYAILPTSFGRKGPHLRRWLVAKSLHQTVSKLRFAGVFLSCKANTWRSVHSPQDHFIILIISDRRDWRDTRGKWPLARNPDRSWWHRHTSLKPFWPQSPWLHGQQDGNFTPDSIAES